MADRPDELYLIDGNSLVYRAFFALPESIATSTGFPTNAIFGFASMLVKILTEHGTRPTVVVWDAGASGRKDVYADYKAGRATRPDLLREQWPHFEPLVEAFGYTNTRLEGFEADDVIATLAERARERSIPVVIVTGDRDAFQLIDPEGLVSVMATSRGITETKLYDHAAVVERYGIGPELIPDFYGLKGDTSDNIPGVPGIGDKTASQLLQRFGDLESVLASVDEISGAKRQQNLREHAEDARVSKRLATAQRDVPVNVDLSECAAEQPDRSRLRETFREFELRDPLRRLEEALGEGEESAPPERADVELAARAVEVPASELARLDGELPALACERPEGAASLRFAAHAGGEEVLVGETETVAALALAWGDRGVVAHDWKAIARLDDAAGASDAGPPLEHDTSVAGYLLDAARRAFPLDELAAEEGLAARVEGADWLAERAVLTRALAERQRAELGERGLERLLHEIELPLVEVLVAMEAAGIAVDVEQLARIGAGYEERIAALEREVYELAGEEFTIGSPQQLAEILFSKLGLSKKRRGKTGFSTDARVLAAIRSEHPIVERIESWRELTKLKSTYLDALPELIDERTGRLHTTFNQTIAATGRLSSTNPNLQNIPV